MSLYTANTKRPRFEVRFASLFVPGRALSFPCDAGGHVDLDGLPTRARNTYYFARALVGRDYAPPSVVDLGGNS